MESLPENCRIPSTPFPSFSPSPSDTPEPTVTQSPTSKMSPTPSISPQRTQIFHDYVQPPIKNIDSDSFELISNGFMTSENDKTEIKIENNKINTVTFEQKCSFVFNWLKSISSFYV